MRTKSKPLALALKSCSQNLCLSRGREAHLSELVHFVFVPSVSYQIKIGNVQSEAKKAKANTIHLFSQQKDAEMVFILLNSLFDHQNVIFIAKC